ncbi:MAG: response regulator [Vicinamibacterales bacterium]
MGNILVVDDNEAVRAMTLYMLKRRGFHVIAAESAEEAVHILADGQTTIDVLVTDQHMTDGLGTDLAAELRQRFPDLPVLVVSGSSEDVPALEGRSAFLEKPFSPDALMQSIQALLAARP